MSDLNIKFWILTMEYHGEGGAVTFPRVLTQDEREMIELLHDLNGGFSRDKLTFTEVELPVQNSHSKATGGGDE